MSAWRPGLPKVVFTPLVKRVRRVTYRLDDVLMEALHIGGEEDARQCLREMTVARRHIVDIWSDRTLFNDAIEGEMNRSIDKGMAYLKRIGQ